jgi:hypothetical protein
MNEIKSYECGNLWLAHFHYSQNAFRSSGVKGEPQSCASAVAHLGHALQACMHTIRWNRNVARPLATLLFLCSRCCCHEGWVYTDSLGGSPLVVARSGEEINKAMVGDRLILFSYWLRLNNRNNVASRLLLVEVSSQLSWLAEGVLGLFQASASRLSTIAGHCRNNPWSAVPDWSQCRNADAGLTWQTNGKTNDAGLTFSPAFRYSGISVLLHQEKCFKNRR